MNPARPLSPAIEDYLEAILTLDSEGQAVRSTDIASQLGLSRAAVSKTMAHLAQEALIEHNLYGRIQLTPIGRQRATEIMHRHQMLKHFLVKGLGVSEATAEQDACRLEHVISEETRLKWMAYIKQTLG